MSEWSRVTKSCPCPVCKKDSWCMIGDEDILCMRVVSVRPYTLKSGEVGYFHAINGEATIVERKHEPPPPVINVGKLLREWARDTRACYLNREAENLGLEVEALHKLGWCWAKEHTAWAIPMRDGRNNYTGIRLRTSSGAKFAVKGSHQGIFIPQMKPNGTLLVTEGPTDTAAGLTLGFYTVGRPSCSGGVHDIVTLVRRITPRRVVIITDNDDAQEMEHGRNPGISGSMALSNQLPVPHCICALPACKDLREYLKNGGTNELLNSIISLQTWIQPRQ